MTKPTILAKIRNHYVDGKYSNIENRMSNWENTFKSLMSSDDVEYDIRTFIRLYREYVKSFGGSLNFDEETKLMKEVISVTRYSDKIKKLRTKMTSLGLDHKLDYEDMELLFEIEGILIQEDL